MKRFIALVASAAFLITAAFSALPVSAAAQKTLASFVYTGGIPEAEVDGDKDAGYAFSSMIPGVDAKLFASVSGEANRKLEWTDAPYAYGLGEEYMPCMTAGNKNPWGSAPYFLVTFSAKGYESIHFSAKIAGSKKGPADYKLQYSTDGSNFRDVPDAGYKITGKVMRASFNNVYIPEIQDAETAYIRIIASSGKCVDDTNPDFPATTGGETAINDIVITGEPLGNDSMISPAFSVPDGKTLCTDDTVRLTDFNGAGAKVFYRIGDGDIVEYSGAFAPFESVRKESVTVSAWSNIGDKNSVSTTVTYKYGGDRLASFGHITEIPNTNQSVIADGGSYKDITRLSATSDGENGFVPLYNTENGYALSPDGGILWEKGGGWTIETSTAGYRDVMLSLSAVSSAKGPAKATLQYSLDGKKFTDFYKDFDLSQKNELSFYRLPDKAAAAPTLYIRLFIENDMRVDGEKLFGNESKGNTYINNIQISGVASGYAMPYSTVGDFAYTGQKIELISPDENEITYSLVYQNGDVITADVKYTAPFALPDKAGVYTLTAYSKNSTKYVKKITVSDGLLAGFNYTEDNFAEHLNTESGELSATESSGTLAMYPGGATAAVPVFEDKYGVKVSAAEDNTWSYTDEQEKGYWLIAFSTKGYKHINLSAMTTGSAKSPRDFALAYSLDGENYTAVQNSSVRNTGSLNATYDGFALPEEISNAEKVYLKIFINGDKSVEDKNLADTVGAGHTGINNIRILGTTLMTEDVKPPLEYLKGDMDKNGALDVNDLTALKASVMAGDKDEDTLALGDMDGNGSLDVNDMTSLKSYIMNA